MLLPCTGPQSPPDGKEAVWEKAAGLAVGPSKLWAELTVGVAGQVEADKEMRDVEARWIAAVHKNMEIEASCRQLEEQIAELKGSSTNGEPGAASEGAAAAAAAAAADGPEDGPQAMETG